MDKAIAAAQAKVAVERILRPLDGDVVRLLLADLLVAHSIGVGVGDQADVQTEVRIRLDGGNINRYKAALTKTEMLLASLDGYPGMPIAALAEEVYGARDKPARAKVRSMLAQQKKRKNPTVESFGNGKWRLIKK